MEKILGPKEVYRLAVDRRMLNTKASEKAPSRPYYRAQYAGITFTVDQAFMDAFEKGTIAEIVLNQNTVQVDDALNPGATKPVERISFGSFATRDQLKGAATFVKEMEQIENPQLNAISLDDDQLQRLQLMLRPPVAQ